MTVPDFTAPFRELAAVFDKPLQGREALAAGYYRGFQELSGRDWQELCREAAIKLDRFPSIHQMKELAESLGFFHARKATLHVAFPWIITVCSCGNAWAVSRKAPDSQQCCCAECERSYTVADIRKTEGRDRVARFDDDRGPGEERGDPEDPDRGIISRQVLT